MSVEIRATEIPEVKLLVPGRFSDARGFLSEVYNAESLREQGIGFTVRQVNHSYSERRGTVRGLHFQLPPHAQAKLVRVTRGAVFDVAVDLRQSSPTLGRWVARELSADNWAQLLVPEGFAHGFCTLEDHTEVSYLLSEVYVPASERGIRWDDPELAIPWPLTGGAANVSERDRSLPGLADVMEAVFP